MSKRAQLFSLDMLFACSLFLLLLVVALTVWQLSRERTQDISERTVLEQKAEVALQTLLLSTGSPQNWYENGSFQSIGLSSGSDYQIDVQRLTGIITLNSSRFRQALGVSEYEVFLNVTNQTGTVFSFGTAVNASAVSVVRVERLASFQGRPVTVQLEVWDDA